MSTRLNDIANELEGLADELKRRGLAGAARQLGSTSEAIRFWDRESGWVPSDGAPSDTAYHRAEIVLCGNRAAVERCVRRMLDRAGFTETNFEMHHVKPELKLEAVTTAATTYSFKTAGPGFRSWALCTVNDLTGELLITSDWGSWSHRWDPRPETLGHPTLTAFIGGRADVDYLARKLQREGRGGRVFSAQATARALLKVLCARRKADGRDQLENRLEPDDYFEGKVPGRLSDRYTDDGLPIFSQNYVDAPTYRDPRRREQLPYLMRREARRIWNQVKAIADELGEGPQAAALFFDRVPSVEGFGDYVTTEPWEHGIDVQTHEDRALRDIVLPALIAACKQRHEAPAATGAVRDMILTVLEDQVAALADSAGLYAIGNPERRKRLEFIADILVSRMQAQ